MSGFFLDFSSISISSGENEKPSDELESTTPTDVSPQIGGETSWNGHPGMWQKLFTILQFYFIF